MFYDKKKLLILFYLLVKNNFGQCFENSSFFPEVLTTVIQLGQKCCFGVFCLSEILKRCIFHLNIMWAFFNISCLSTARILWIILILYLIKIGLFIGEYVKWEITTTEPSAESMKRGTVSGSRLLRALFLTVSVRVLRWIRSRRGIFQHTNIGSIIFLSVSCSLKTFYFSWPLYWGPNSVCTWNMLTVTKSYVATNATPDTFLLEEYQQYTLRFFWQNDCRCALTEKHSQTLEIDFHKKQSWTFSENAMHLWFSAVWKILFRSH